MPLRYADFGSRLHEALSRTLRAAQLADVIRRLLCVQTFSYTFINGADSMRTIVCLSMVLLLFTLNAHADSNYEFRNSSPNSIVVRMDTWREKHAIAPNGSAVFTKANVLDQPTFWVYIDGNKDGEPDKATQEASKKVPLEWASNARGVLEWDGKNIIFY